MKKHHRAECVCDTCWEAGKRGGVFPAAGAEARVGLLEGRAERLKEANGVGVRMITDLRTQLAAANKLADEARDIPEEVQRLAGQLEASNETMLFAAERMAKLKEAVRLWSGLTSKFAQHRPMCDRITSAMKCSCGLNDAIKQAQAAEGSQ